MGVSPATGAFTAECLCMAMGFGLQGLGCLRAASLELEL